MGCAQSRVDNEEAVTRCRDQKQWMKEAVTACNAFAASHSAYTVALKNIGATLSEFGQGEVTAAPASASAGGTVGHPSAVASIQPLVDTLPPPPPPLPDFSPSALQCSISMPDLSLPHPSVKFPSKSPPPWMPPSARRRRRRMTAAATAETSRSTVTTAAPLPRAPPPPLPRRRLPKPLHRRQCWRSPPGTTSPRTSTCPTHPWVTLWRLGWKERWLWRKASEDRPHHLCPPPWIPTWPVLMMTLR